MPDLKRTYPQRFHHLIKYLSRRNEITVICVKAWWLEQLQDKYSDDCLKNIELKYATDQRINSFFQETLIVKRYAFKPSLKQEFDVLVSFNDLIAAYFVCKRSQIPMVFDLSDDMAEYVGVSSQVPRVLMPFGKHIGRQMIQKNINISQKIAYTLESLRERYAISNDKSLLIPNGVDLEFFQAHSNLSKNADIGAREFTVGFAGFLGNWIDFSHLLKGLRRLIEKGYKINLLIVGDGPARKHIKEIAQQLNVLDKINFVGSVSYDEIPVYIHLMDVCLIPFNKGAVADHALPLKLLEYLACQKPVISTELRGVVEAVGDAVLYASDETEFESQLTKLYNDEDYRIELGMRGRKIVEERYSWGSIGLQFEHLLAESTL
jgi:glycosyltransferase involved in cell wall biosynthesis